MTPRPALAATLVAVLTLTGGCSVSTSPPDDDARTGTTRAVLVDDRLTLDLTDGLTRAEAGIAPGEATASYSRPGGEAAITATLVLAPDLRLERAVSLVAISGESVTDPEAEPTTVELRRSVGGVDAAQAALDQDVADLGIPADEVAAWAEGARAAVARGDELSYRTRVFRAPDVGGLQVEVEAALFVDRDEVGLRHVVTLPT